MRGLGRRAAALRTRRHHPRDHSRVRAQVHVGARLQQRGGLQKDTGLLHGHAAPPSVPTVRITVYSHWSRNDFLEVHLSMEYSGERTDLARVSCACGLWKEPHGYNTCMRHSCVIIAIFRCEGEEFCSVSSEASTHHILQSCCTSNFCHSSNILRLTYTCVPSEYLSCGNFEVQQCFCVYN